MLTLVCIAHLCIFLTSQFYETAQGIRPGQSLRSEWPFRQCYNIEEIGLQRPERDKIRSYYYCITVFCEKAVKILLQFRTFNPLAVVAKMAVGFVLSRDVEP